MAIKILLADDHQLVRKGIRQLIEAEPDMDVVGEAADGQQIVRMFLETTPDVVVTDIGMPGLNGIEATRRLTDLEPNARILALSMHNDPGYVTEILAAGAKGYLVKDAAVEELIRAVRTVASGMTYLSPTIAGDVVDEHIRNSPKQDRDSAFTVLTDREREVLQPLAEGRTTKEIAKTIHRSVKTVESHRRNIMKKLDLHTVADLTKYAVQHGLTDLE